MPVVVPRWLGGGATTVDSSGLLFVCAGAFEGLYDAVYDRVTIGADKGSLQPVTVVEGGKVREELQFELRDWLRNEDLFDYGMSSQFLSRFDAVVMLKDLGEEELLKIFLEGPDSGSIHTRALKEVFRRVIRDFEFAPEKHAGGGVLMIDQHHVAAALGE